MPSAAAKKTSVIVLLSVVGALLLAGPGCRLFESNKPAADGTSAADDTDAPAPWFQHAPTISFAHVQPGVRSEFYLDLVALPKPPIAHDQDGEPPQVSVTLSGPGVMGEPRETRPYRNGQPLHFSWSISRFGQYTAVVSVVNDSQEVYRAEAKETVR